MFVPQPSARVTFVEHSAIFPASARRYLPTRNEFAVACYLDLIPGLAEHFIYLNAGMFFGAALTPWDFYTRSGLPKVHTRLAHAASDEAERALQKSNRLRTPPPPSAPSPPRPLAPSPPVRCLVASQLLWACRALRCIGATGLCRKRSSATSGTHARPCAAIRSLLRGVQWTCSTTSTPVAAR